MKYSLGLLVLVASLHCGAWAQSAPVSDAPEYARISEMWRTLTASIDRQTPLVKTLTEAQATQQGKFTPSETRAELLEQVIREHELQLALLRQMLQEERPFAPLHWQQAAVAQVEAATKPVRNTRPRGRAGRRRR